MVWRAEDPQGRESAKIRWECVPYCLGDVIDIGAGEEKIFPHALGVDNCKDNVLFGAQIRPDLRVDSAERLPQFADGSWDTVFSSHTLEHIEDYHAALAEWWRLVRPGGYMILYLPSANLYPKRGETGSNPDHKHDFTLDDIVAAMREIGHWDLVRNEERSERREYSLFQVFRKRTDGQWSESWKGSRPTRTLGLVRLGAYGDALWVTSILPHLKAQGYDITVYTQDAGEEILRSDPNVSRIVKMPEKMFEGFHIYDFLRWEEQKYTRFINLVGSVETDLLPTSKDVRFYLPDEVRRRIMDENYLQAIHKWAGVPFTRHAEKREFTGTAPRVRFTPTEDERNRAFARRMAIDKRVVVLNPAGSGRFKWYPHAPELARQLAAQGLHVVVFGDLPKRAEYEGIDGVQCVFKDWPIRDVLAFALVSDIVIGPESAITNAVSFESMLKIVLLSHSTENNLTRDWMPPTTSICAEGLDCYPCHRIHYDMTHCAIDEKSRAAACQAAVKPEQIAEVVADYVMWLDEQARSAA
jgi:ADP-heptose:LPS heptosyltransferase/predicted SAM-dependent methyltransferase